MSFVWHLALWRREWRERSFCWPWVSAKYQKMQSTQLSTEKRRRNLLLFYGFRMVCWNTPHVTGSRSSNRSAYCRPRLRRHGREPGGMAILPCTTTATTAVSTTRERVCGSQAGEKNTTVADQVAVETVHSDPSLSLEPVVFLQKSATKKKKYLDLEITGNSTSFFDGSCNEFVTA